MKKTVSQHYIKRHSQFSQSLSSVSDQIRCFRVAILGHLHFNMNFSIGVSISGVCVGGGAAGIVTMNVMNQKVTWRACDSVFQSMTVGYLPTCFFQ